MKNFFSIQKKLTLILLLVTLMPIISFGYLINLHTKKYLQEDYIKSTIREITQVDNYINLFFESLKKDCAMLAKNPIVKSSDSSITKYFKESENTSLLNGDIEKKIFEIYLNYKESYPELEYIYIATTEGGLVKWPNTGIPIDYDPRNDEWYKLAIKNKREVIVTEPDFWEVDEKTIVHIATTVENENKEIVGVQGIDVSLKNLAEMLQKRSIGETGYIILTTNTGKIIAHPKKPKLSGKGIETLNISQKNTITELKDGSFITEMDSKECLVNVYTSSNTGFKFIAVIDKTELMQSIKKEQFIIWPLSLLIIIIVIFISILFSKSFTKPIIKSAEFAKEISSGNLSLKPLSAYANDEIGVLCNSLNDMHSNLKAMIFELASVAKQMVTDTLSENSTNKKNVIENIKPGVIFGAMKALEEAGETLRESEERYRLLVEYSHDVIIIYHEGKIVLANSAIDKLLGIKDHKQVLGQYLMNFVHPDHREIAQKRIKNVLQSGDIEGFSEYKVLKADGSIIDIEANIVPYLYKGKNAVQIVWRDITERKRIEKEVQKILKLESLGVLAGGLAHDFNNVLTVIQGNVSLAKINAKKDEKTYTRLVEVEKAIEQAKQLTLQLLTFSKGGDPVKKVINMNKLLKSTVDLALSGTNVKSIFNISDDLDPVKVDEGQINQIINNLTINAVQAMPDGGIFYVSAENYYLDNNQSIPLESGHYIKMSFEDKGKGILEENFSRLFDPFFTTKETGNGLGLATSYSILKKHGGHISVCSKVGFGTTFNVFLPAIKNKLDLTESKKEKLYTGEGKILVMDDDLDIRKVASEMLAFLGYEVEVASNGEEAIRIYKRAIVSQKPFDAVILDLTIRGGLGGKETIKKIKEIDPNVKALVASGYSNDPVLANYKEYGFEGFFIKPYEINILGKEIYRLLNS